MILSILSLFGPVNIRSLMWYKTTIFKALFIKAPLSYGKTVKPCLINILLKNLYYNLRLYFKLYKAFISLRVFPLGKSL
jgi:hypothetical protein